MNAYLMSRMDRIASAYRFFNEQLKNAEMEGLQFSCSCPMPKFLGSDKLSDSEINDLKNHWLEEGGEI